MLRIAAQSSYAGSARKPKWEGICLIARAILRGGIARSARCARSEESAKLVYRFRVGGLVLTNLEAEEIVDGIERGRVGGLDDHAGAVGGFLVGVHDFLAQALHRGRARGDRIVDEHRKSKISPGKLARDMRQMSPNDVAVRCVRGILDLNLNHAAVGLQQKMVYRGVL